MPVKLSFLETCVLFSIIIGVVLCGYCDIHQNHLLCGDHYDPSCGDISKLLSTEPSQEDIDQILKVHNSYRNFVASGRARGGRLRFFPQASNMEEMVWDRELAALSKSKVKTCLIWPSCPDCTVVERFWWVGQNLFSGAIPVRLITNDEEEKRFEIWRHIIMHFTVREALNFDVDDVSYLTYHKNKLGIDIDKFSRITNSIWAKTTRIGCALIGFNHPFATSILSLFAACHYAPSASYKEYEVYKVGEPCSMCEGMGRNCSVVYPNLCVCGLLSLFPLNMWSTK